MIHKIHLAPMAGVSDMTFRIICREYGADGLTTEMVSAKGLFYKSTKTASLMKIDEREIPAAIQFFGSEPDIMAAAVPFAESSGASAIDINMGCPMPKIVNNGDGSALMKNPPLAGLIVRKMADVSHIPITVKIRKGWDRDTAAEFARVLESNGASAITVHGRTRNQLYQGKADWETIKAVKRAVKIPVIGNGDIFSADDAAKMLDFTGCDGIAVGRGARGNPFIFRQIKELFDNGCVSYTPAPYDRITAAIRHLEMLCSEIGENRGVLESRKHIAWYIKGIPGSAEVKNKIFTLTKQSEIAEMLYETSQKLK